MGCRTELRLVTLPEVPRKGVGSENAEDPVKETIVNLLANGSDIYMTNLRTRSQKEGKNRTGIRSGAKQGGS